MDKTIALDEGYPDDATQLLGEVLVARGQCDSKTIERARQVAEENRQALESVLVRLGLVGERGLAEAYAAMLGLSLVAPESYPAEPVLPDRLKPAFLREARVVPLSVSNNTLVLAMSNPLDRFAGAAVAAATGHIITRQVGVPIELEHALQRLYPEPGGDGEKPTPEASSADGVEDDAERLKDLASEAPVIRLVNQIISRAVESQASDIHIEPFEDRLRVRYRYDGLLHEAESPPKRLAAAITSRVKIMAKLDIAERRLPQDGRIRMAVRGQDVDFRVSTVPCMYGETVVMRVLDRSAVTFNYGDLGLSPAIVGKLTAALELPNGIVLVTGPTGSGKTTTLYTGLLGLNSVARKIVTIEDPIEYQLRGINQIQVKPQIDLTFANLLRSILRQDPDVIMVGEIRDLETAQIAVQAALTGHLVLSTLHTNSAAASITRLRDMGLEDYLLTAVLRGVLAQRLVRRLCVRCRRAVPAPPELVQRFDLARRSAQRPITLWHPVGCTHCRSTGYRGRLAMAEYLEPNADIERLIFERADHTRIERAATEAGMVTMFETGIRAALDGVTTVEEVVRSIRAGA
ncbi:MAG: Flp pilus assembly complex ATPase component TadA [Acetobacteraceae bacterium]|nr:Flp pilus assembly complex ATPase component TadA [Acetobacteraceae bacterium]MBV8573647.1 Flp pilus assembly complex ATPase component TadA [Acetobacteraceae bacterium]